MRKLPSVTSKIASAVAAIAMVAAAFVAASPSTANAALYNIFPADADGTPQGVFYADDALFATMTSDLAGGRACIVDATVTDPSAANCQSGVAWGFPHTYIGMGTLAGYPMSSPPLPVGQWRLMLATLDGRTGTELSEVFEVRPCQGECDESAAQSQLAPWKAKAAVAMDSVESLEYIAAADKAMSLYNSLAGVAGDVVKGGGIGGVLMGIGTGMVEGLFANPWDAHKDMAMAILRPLHATGYRMWGGIARDPARYDYDVDTQPEFTTPPVLAADDFEPALSAQQLGVMNTYATLTMEAAAYGDASRLANERYQGAIEQSAFEAAASQAHAASSYTFALNQRLRALQDVQAQVAAMPWAQQPAFPDPSAVFDIPAGQTADGFFHEIIDTAQATYANGITPEYRDSLLNCEFYDEPPAVCPITNEMIDYTISLWQDSEWVDGWANYNIDETPASTLLNYNSQLPGIIETYDAFGRWMGLQEGRATVQTPAGQPNQAPTASFTQSLNEGTAPLTVTFTSTSTDPEDDENTLKLLWDFAGKSKVSGTQAEKNTVSYTFDKPGIYYIGLVATDSEGLWNQAVKEIRVYPGESPGDPGSGEEPAGNRAPVAGFTPANPVLGPPDSPPYSQVFSAIGDDPLNPLSYDEDGDALTFEWFFGDGSTYTGPTVTKEFDEGYVMSVVLKVSDGWRTTQASGEVTANWSSGGSPDPNEAPVASFTATPTTGNAPLQVLFTSTSTDADGDTLTHAWDFGNGQADGNKKVTAHTFTDPGTYEVTLTVSDGQVASTATQHIIVDPPVQPLAANFTTSQRYDAASLIQGSRMLSTGVDHYGTSVPTNIIQPDTSMWRTNTGVTGGQTFIVELANGGRDPIDTIGLVSYGSTYGAKHVTVELTNSTNPFIAYTTVFDGDLERVSTEQQFPITPQQARYLRLTIHDNYGTNYVALRNIFAYTAPAQGGIVSATNVGTPATIVAASSEYSTAYSAAKILEPGTSRWSSALGASSDHFIRAALGGNGPHRIASFVVRGSGRGNYGTKDFEIWTSPTGEESSFVKAVEGTLPQSYDPVTFDLASPVDANYFEIRMLSNHGNVNYVELTEVQALTTSRMNVASAVPFGAQVLETTAGDANPIFDPNSGSYWNATGAGSHSATLALLDSDSYTVDRVWLEPYPSWRPRTVQIQTSMDGVTFDTVAEVGMVDANDGRWIVFDPVEASVVKIVAVDGHTASGVRIRNVRVYAVDQNNGKDVTFSDLSTGGITGWAWDFGDGATSTERSPIHSFAGPGTYNVTLTVTNSGGETSTVTRPYSVPVLPVPQIKATAGSAGGPALPETPDGAVIVNENDLVFMHASAVDGSKQAGWEWSGDWTPTNITSIAPTVSARAGDQGRHAVKTRATTAQGYTSDFRSRIVVVNNVNPTLGGDSPMAGTAQEEVLLPSNMSVSDPKDTVTCTVDWGDGTAATEITACSTSKLRAAKHAYALPGTYPVKVTADDGGNLGPDGLEYGEPGIATLGIQAAVTHRDAFLQVVRARAVDGDLQVRARILDAGSVLPIENSSVTVTASDGTTRTATSDSGGYLDVVLPSAVASADVTLSYAGSTLHNPASLTRPVRAPKADIMFVVDESASMGSYQSQVQQHLPLIAQGLAPYLDFRLGVTGYAGGYNAGAGKVLSDFSADMSAFRQSVGELRVSSGNANAWEGIMVGLGYELPGNDPANAIAVSDKVHPDPNAASCVVLVSDAGVSEVASARPKATRAHAEAAIANWNATVFSFIANDQNTRDAYGMGPGIAGATGGDSWRVTDLANEEVVGALVSKCITKALTPDLAVTVSGPAEPVAPKTDVTLTATASNIAAIDVPRVSMTVELPDGATYKSSSNGGSFDSDTNTVSWPLFNLAAGEDVPYSVTVQVEGAGLLPGDHEYDFSSSVSYDGSLGEERTMANNDAATTVTLRVPEPDPDPDPDPEPEPAPDLAAAIAGPTEPVGVGTAVSVLATASNSGPVDVPNVAVTMELPTGATYRSSTDGGTYDSTTRAVTWPVFALEAGASVTRTVTIELGDSTVAPGDHGYVFSSTVSYDGSLGEEETLTNNNASTTVTLRVPESEPDPDPEAIWGAERHWGPTRYETAIAVSKEGYPDGSSVVYLATGQNFPDALVAAPAAAKEGGPLLLTQTKRLPEVVAAELVRLNPSTVVIVGGPGAVSSAVEREVKATLASAAVVRVGGKDRYGTANGIADRMWGASGATTVYLATGRTFPDALSASPAASATDGPVLIVQGKGKALPPDTAAMARKLQVREINVVGGTGAVSAAIESSLKGQTGATKVQRFGGKDRYETSILINRHAFTQSDELFLATGRDFADALSGGALAAKRHAPLYVITPRCVPQAIIDDSAQLKTTKVHILGGTGALHKAVEDKKTC